jgi:hypothetical protein
MAADQVDRAEENNAAVGYGFDPQVGVGRTSWVSNRWCVGGSGWQGGRWLVRGSITVGYAEVPDSGG